MNKDSEKKRRNEEKKKHILFAIRDKQYLSSGIGAGPP